MTYSVRITPLAEAAIREQARYIAIDCKAPLSAARWLSRIFTAANTLDTWPRRCSKAEEYRYRDYEVRQLDVQGFLLLFTVVDETKTVWVIGARHGRMQPRPDELPGDVADVEEQDED